MDPSLSWIDPSRLADVLGRAGLLPVAAAREAVAPSRSRPPVSDLGLIPSDAPPASSSGMSRARGERFTRPPGGTLQSSLKAYFSWIVQQTGSRRLFVMDEEGLVLMEKDSDPVLIAISSSFMSLLERIHSCLDSRTRSSIAIDLEGGQVLHLFQVETTLGRYAMGVVVSQPIRPDLVQSFREGLTVAMNESE